MKQKKKRILSLVLIGSLCLGIWQLSVSAESQLYQEKHEEAKKYVDLIDFDFVKTAELGDSIKLAFLEIEKFTQKYENYTMEDIKQIICSSTNKSINANSAIPYSYTDYLPVDEDRLNYKEKELFNSDPARGAMVLLNAAQANEKEKAYYGSNTKGTNGDAFRHSFWNALNARSCGTAYAEAFATAHETGSADYNPYSIDTKMDLYNNKVGRDLMIGKDYSYAPSPSAVIYMISQDDLKAVKQGKMLRYTGSDVYSYMCLVPTNSDSKN